MAISKQVVALEEEGDITRNAELITDILQRRLSSLGFCNLPILATERADVIFHVSRSLSEEEEEAAAAEGKRKGNAKNHRTEEEEEEEEEEGKEKEVKIVRILAHSSMLKKECDYFREILQEEEEEDVDGDGDDDDDVASMSSAPDSESSFPEEDSECLSPKDSECSLSREEGSDRMSQEDSEYMSREEDSNTSREDSDARVLAISTDENNDPFFKQQNVSFPRKHRRSILLKDRPRRSRKNSRRNLSSNSNGSHRKSVRFSITPADIIPLKNDTSNVMGQNEEEKNLRIDQLKLKEAKKTEAEIASVDDDNDKVKNPNALRMTYIDKTMIKRRNTEVNIMVQNLDDKKGSKEKNEQKAKKDDSLRFFIVKKHNWTSSVLIGILEWLYCGVAHINIVDLALTYDAAYRAAMTSLTWCIKRHSIIDYLNLAVTNYPTYCQSLLNLANLANCEELSTLKCFCKALHAISGKSKVVKVETKSLPGRSKDFLSEGFLVLDGHPVCVLKSNDDDDNGGLTDEELSRPLPFLTFARGIQKPVSLNPLDQCKISLNRNRSKEQTWNVILLDNDQAGSFHAFFNYATLCNLNNISKIAWKDMKGMMKEGFELQVIAKCKVGPILVESLKKEIKQALTVREERGSGPYVKGPSYCTSLVVEGDPSKLLLAAKAMSYDMVGRASLKIRAPKLKTFGKLFHANHTFGLDLQRRSVVLVKPLYMLIKVLEFITNLNDDAYEDPATERTFVELIEPTKVF